MPQLETLERHCKEAISRNAANAAEICGRISGYVDAVDGGVYVYDARTFGHDLNEQDELLDEYFSLGPDASAVHAQLHVENSTKSPVFSRSNKTVNENMKLDTIQTIVKDYDWLLQRNLTMLIYVGQFDMLDGPVGIQKWMKKLNYWDSAHFHEQSRKIYRYDDAEGENRVGGYYKQSNHLSFLIVYGAGHLVPTN